MTVTGPLEAAELEAAIEKAPDDRAPYLAYGAWLRTRGDLRGELVGLQCAGRIEEASALIDAHRAHFWGPGAGILDALTPHEDAKGRATTWRWGFLESLWLWDQFDYARRNYRGRRAFDTAEVLQSLLAHPSARFLRELSIGTLANDDTYQELAEVIQCTARPTLDKLLLGDTDEQAFDGTVTGLEPLAELDGLTDLTLIGRVLLPGTARPLRLKQLQIITDIARYDSLPHICDASWPEIERLRLSVGGNTIAPTALVPILDGRCFPKLKHLELRFTASPGLCEVIAASAMAQQIEVLGLSGAALDDRDAAALSAMRFPRLRELDVSSNMLTERGIKLLQTLCPIVRADSQDP